MVRSPKLSVVTDGANFSTEMTGRRRRRRTKPNALYEKGGRGEKERRH